MSEFYMIIVRKNIFPIFLGGDTCPPAPVSYAPWRERKQCMTGTGCRKGEEGEELRLGEGEG